MALNGQYFLKDGEWQQGNKEDFPDCTEAWFKDDVYHRDGGPALIPAFAGADRQWFKNGLRHREDGPAVVGTDRSVWYFINTKNITRDVHNWIYENNYPKWENENSWDDGIKMHFKLTFVG